MVPDFGLSVGTLLLIEAVYKLFLIVFLVTLRFKTSRFHIASFHSCELSGEPTICFISDMQL
jgi:hypothetical protein